MTLVPLPERECLAIETLVKNRCEELGLRPADLIRRTAYKNHAKGLRRLDALLAGDLDLAKDLISNLPDALEVASCVVESAILQTRNQIAALEETQRVAREAAYRAAFQPHAIIMTEIDCPRPLFAAAFLAAKRLRNIDFEPGSAPSTYPAQAVEGLRQKIDQCADESPYSAGSLLGYGRPIGLVINYTPELAVRCNLDGVPFEIRNRAQVVGTVEFVGKTGPVIARLIGGKRSGREGTTEGNNRRPV